MCPIADVQPTDVSRAPEGNERLGADAQLRVIIAEDSYLIREVLTMTLGSARGTPT
jgi:hypothetical protein